jgi:hypothetical protein
VRGGVQRHRNNCCTGGTERNTAARRSGTGGRAPIDAMQPRLAQRRDLTGARATNGVDAGDARNDSPHLILAGPPQTHLV